MSINIMKKKFNKKYLIAAPVIVIILGVLLLNSNNGNGHEGVEVVRGNLAQQLFETGSVEKGEDIVLSFKDGGQIESVFVEEGDTVKRGDVVAQLSTADLQLSLQEAEARLEVARATRDGVNRGAREQDIDVLRASVRSAETALSNAKVSLQEQERLVQEALRSVHRGGVASLGTVNLLGDVHSAVRDIEIGVIDIAREYFSSMVVAETTSGRRSRDEIRRSVRSIEDYRELATREGVTYEEKEDALRVTERELRKMISEVDNLIRVAESDFYKDRFLSSDVELLRNYRRTLNNTLSSVTGLIGSISAVKVETAASITSAKSNVRSAESALREAEQRLLQVQAGPDSYDVRVGDANVRQAESQVSLIRRRISDATLVSPVDGVVSRIGGRGNEVVPATSPVVVITPAVDLQITVDIYEGDVAKISSGNKATVSFLAFSGEDFEGEVIFVNPVGKIVDGIIYYEIKIVLDNYPENILPQMTADVNIVTAERENVLMLPERAVVRKDGRQHVRVLANGTVEEVEITTGLRGEGRMVEVLSGLKEGDFVITD